MRYSPGARESSGLREACGDKLNLKPLTSDDVPVLEESGMGEWGYKYGIRT